MAKAGVKRKALSLNEKYEIVLELEAGKKQSEVVADKGLPHSTISTLWKGRNKIKSDFSTSPGSSKRSRTGR